MQKLMGKEMAMKVDIWQRFCIGYEASYQVFELILNAMKHIEIEVFKGDKPTNNN